MRSRIRRFGEHGNRVLLFELNGNAVVQWSVSGRRKTRSFKLAEYANRALEFARGISKGKKDDIGQSAIVAMPELITLREMWEAYISTESPHLRQRSIDLYTDDWKRWELMYDRNTLVASTTKLWMPKFAAEMRARGLAAGTIKAQVRTIKRVYAWGAATLDTADVVHFYKFKAHKDERRDKPADYRPEEWEKILAQLDPESPTQWRPWVALTICGEQGARQNAVLHLQWPDTGLHPDSRLFDDLLVTEGRIEWRAVWDKTGKAWSQPVRAGTRRALSVARGWRLKLGYTGPWVIPAGSSKNAGDGCYTPQSLWTALRGAEDRAEVKHIDRRAGHGSRKMLATKVMAKTKDPALATAAIGDSIAQASTYIKTHADAVDDAIRQLDEVTA